MEITVFIPEINLNETRKEWLIVLFDYEQGKPYTRISSYERVPIPISSA